MVNMFGMIVGATLIPLVYWFLRTVFFYSGVSEAAPGYSKMIALHFMQTRNSLAWEVCFHKFYYVIPT